MKDDLQQFSFSEHYLDLRRRIVISFAVFITVALFIYLKIDGVYNLLLRQLYVNSKNPNPAVFTNITEKFFTDITLSCFLAFLISLPFFILQLYFFIKPALYHEERKIFVNYTGTSLLLFFGGLLFCYSFLLPISCIFFLNSADSRYLSDLGDENVTMDTNIVFLPKISEYIDFIVHFSVIIGLVFIFPVVILLLNRLRLVRKSTFVSLRRYFIVFIFILAAIVTPPDVITQIAVAVPLVILYEIAVLLCKDWDIQYKNPI